MEFLYAVSGYRAQHHASFSLVVVVAVGQTSATGNRSLDNRYGIKHTP